MAAVIGWLRRADGAGAPPARAAWPDMLLAAGVGGAALLLLGALTAASGTPLVLGSFGASAVLVFGYPRGPFSSLRAVLGGHLLASLIGLAVLHAGGDGPLGLGLAVALTILGMMALRVVHPPAGSNPVIVHLLHPGWDFLLWPTLLGALVVVLVMLAQRRLTRPPVAP
jgi:CBS-domain-containing membrane protein